MMDVMWLVQYQAPSNARWCKLVNIQVRSSHCGTMAMPGPMFDPRPSIVGRRIQHCHSCGVACNWLGFDPWHRSPYAKKEKKKNSSKKRKKIQVTQVVIVLHVPCFVLFSTHLCCCPYKVLGPTNSFRCSGGRTEWDCVPKSHFSGTQIGLTNK